jgi:hypothetical protein
MFGVWEIILYVMGLSFVMEGMFSNLVENLSQFFPITLDLHRVGPNNPVLRQLTPLLGL